MKQAVVIGATSGIGRSLALKLVAAGWRVGVVGRREALLRELKECYPTAFSYAAVDIAQPAACLNALSDLVERMGGMHLCVVCAGTGELNPSLDFTLEEPFALTNIRGAGREAAQREKGRGGRWTAARPAKKRNKTGGKEKFCLLLRFRSKQESSK